MLNWSEYKKRMEADASVGVQIDRLGEKVIADNRKYVEVLMEGILYCAEQGLPDMMRAIFHLILAITRQFSLRFCLVTLLSLGVD
jgi:hypothetical protein